MRVCHLPETKNFFLCLFLSLSVLDLFELLIEKKWDLSRLVGLFVLTRVEPTGNMLDLRMHCVKSIHFKIYANRKELTGSAKRVDKFPTVQILLDRTVSIVSSITAQM